MSNEWEKTGSKPDPLNIVSLGMADITIHTYKNDKTGEERDVATWTSSEEEMEKAAGEAISKGNFLR